MDLNAATDFLESTAANSGLTFTTPEGLQAAAAKLAATVERDAAGRLAYTPQGEAEGFEIQAGEVVNVPVERHVGMLIRQHTAPVASPRSPGPASTPEPAAEPAYVTLRVGSSTSVRKADDPMVTIMAAFQAQHDAEVRSKIPSFGYPWLKNSFNRTHQAMIQNKQPALAAKLKAEAGV